MGVVRLPGKEGEEMRLGQRIAGTDEAERLEEFEVTGLKKLKEKQKFICEWSHCFQSLLCSI